MQIIKRFTALTLAAGLIFAPSLAAYAGEGTAAGSEGVDTSRKGSISVTMSCDGETVPGGTLALYRVGEICVDDVNYSFALTEEFAGSGSSLEDISSAALASDLASYASETGLAGTEVSIGDDGEAAANGLTLGLYLVVQTEAADGYEAVDPFLVSVPMREDGAYVYDVDATPKMSALTEVSTSNTPGTGTPNTSETSETPVSPGSSKNAVTALTSLPQTGQLNWPVPVLVWLGLCFLLAGFRLRCKEELR